MFRFTIRDVLWLMVVAGMGVGWWLSKRDLDKSRQVAVSDARKLLRIVADPWSYPLPEQERVKLLESYFPGENTTNWIGRYTPATEDEFIRQGGLQRLK